MRETPKVDTSGAGGNFPAPEAESSFGLGTEGLEMK